MITIPIAQNSSEYVPPPKICPNEVTLPIPVPGTWIGVECEITSDNPSSVNNIPRVATNDAIPT